MRKLFTSRLFRCVLCLVLVCCIVVNCCAIKVSAFTLTGTAIALFGDDAIALIAACVIGLGVMADTASQTSMLEFRYLCDQAYDAMAAAGEWVVDGAITLYNCGTELWDYGVDCGIVQWLHDWLWADSGVLGTSYLPDVTFDSSIVNSAIYNASLHAYAVLLDCPGCAYVAYADSPFIVTPRSGGGYDLKTEDGSSFYSWREVWNSWDYHSNTAWFGSGTIHYFGQANPSVVTTYDIVLGEVALPGTEIETEYGEYIVIVAPNGVPDTGGDGSGDDQPKIPIIPVPVLPSYEETIQLPQEEIWKGNKVETEDPDTGGSTDPSTGTDTDDPDSGSNDPTTPTTGTDTDPDTQPDSPGASSTNIGDYQIDLKKFFPFCIPFDLYDFFTCLNADPVAPVIEWVIPLPGGGTYPLVIDLSAFDSVAQLLRRLQLLLFCVGLAFKTRDLIKG